DLETQLKKISLLSDYSLATNTPTTHMSSQGRLTLKSVKFEGRNNTRLSPSVDFEYELPSPKSHSNVQITHVPSDFSDPRHGRVDMGSTVNTFEVGDIVKMTISGTTFHASLIRGIVHA